MCGSTKESTDEGTDQIFCSDCGRIKAARAIVSNLQFSNQQVSGQFGNKTGEYSRIRSIRGISRDTDEIRLGKAFKLIHSLSLSLNLPNYIKEVNIGSYF